MNLRKFSQGVVMRLGLRTLTLMVCLGLSGCGALWDAAFPPEDPRARVTFHLASDRPQAGWDLRSAAMGARTVYVQPQVLMTAADITDAAALVSRLQQYYVGVEVTPQAATQLRLATARLAPGHALVVMDQRQLVGVMPLTEPITGNQFAIPARSALAAQQLMAFLSPHPEDKRLR